MASVREFFLDEANQCLRALDQVLADASAAPLDANALLRHVRTLRGSAQMAREEHVHAVARRLEAVARGLVDRRIQWTADLARRVAETVSDLRALANGSEGDDAARARAAAATSRLPEADGDAARRDASPATGASDERLAFLAFAAREVSGIVAELDRALPILARAPRNREPLKAILRRQRVLLGAARVDAIPAVAETLRAIDSVSRLVARQDAAVEGDWLQLYRTARDVLAEASMHLLGGADASEPTTGALQALRTLRDRLHQRYGEPGGAPPQAPRLPTGDVPADVDGFFRSEARILLDRIERMARALEEGTPDRQATLAREISSALSALRDTAQTFGFAEVARRAEATLSRVRGSNAAEVLALLPHLQEAVNAGAAATPTPAAEDGVVPIESLFYQGDELVKHAEELARVVESALPAGHQARDALAGILAMLRQVAS